MAGVLSTIPCCGPLQNQGYTADGESYNAMWIPIFLVCAAFFLAWAIGQALIDDYDMIGVPDEVL